MMMAMCWFGRLCFSLLINDASQKRGNAVWWWSGAKVNGVDAAGRRMIMASGQALRCLIDV
ncbi:hypothetical protein BHS06_00955 [Myxococcus xanthus]|nr:hypothetical protein BHS06_00955 [Myxococcus xanthus]